MIPSDLLYTNEHEWVRVNGDMAEVGITHFAQDQLGDIVFVEVPELGRVLAAGETFGVVESVKTVSDLFAPVSGKVMEVNPILVEENGEFAPEIVNEDPYEKGWMIRIEMSDKAELGKLLDAASYTKIAEA